MKKKGSLVGRIVAIISVAVAIGTVILATLGILEVRNTYMDMTKEELHAAVIQADSEFTMMWDGDWEYDGTTLTKGGEEVYEEYLTTMEKLKAETGLEYTIFYNDTRVCTTLKKAGGGEYLLNTQAKPEVVDAVVGRGEYAYKPGIEIEGSKYYGYYSPMSNTDGSNVGMMFVGRPADTITKAITRITVTLVIIALLILIALIAIGVIAASKASKAMNMISEGIAEISSGDLTVEIPEELTRRNDELGTIATSAENLRNKLCDVIGTSVSLAGNVSSSGNELSDSAEQASAASSQVTDAVNDISEGAVSQAESVQDSAANVGEIGIDIETISDNVATLNSNTDEMQTACNNTMKALEKLLAQNNDVVNSMQEIDEQIRKTNQAVQNISDSSKLITGIAGQTNLLALNASIEAARAGEAGRGFAVVAEEIGQLAAQSAETAREINEIIVELTAESEKSIATIELMNEELNEQSHQLDSTKEDMENMQKGVESVSQNAGEISSRVSNLDSSKANLVEIIDSLSAISQENAASTEETNASMEELNATFEIINKASEDLKDLAVQLNDKISYFTIEA